jgi:hypothetical protein
MLLSKNLLLLTVEFKLKSKNTTIDKRVLLASFFAKTKKFVVNIFLILNFNLVTLDFANCERLLKNITTIFFKKLLNFDRLIYSDNNEKELRELEKLSTIRQR